MFSYGLRTIVGGVPYTYGQFVASFLQCIGDVEAERGITAFVLAYAGVVHPHMGSPVYGTEMQQYSFPFPSGRYFKLPCIPQFLTVFHVHAYS